MGHSISYIRFDGPIRGRHLLASQIVLSAGRALTMSTKALCQILKTHSICLLTSHIPSGGGSALFQMNSSKLWHVPSNLVRSSSSTPAMLPSVIAPKNSGLTTTRVLTKSAYKCAGPVRMG